MEKNIFWIASLIGFTLLLLTGGLLGFDTPSVILSSIVYWVLRYYNYTKIEG